jgi:hypothetical protein
MNEQTQTPAPQEVVPVVVPAAAAAVAELPRLEREAESKAEPAPATRTAQSASPADQLPTTRLPSIAPLLPPPVPPPGPAHRTQPLRAITRDAAAAKLADAGKRRPWKNVLGHVTRAAAAVPSSVGSLRFDALRSEAWTQRRVGVTCAAVGVTMIAGALILGWLSIAVDRFDKVEPASIVVAIVLARAALAIATMMVGFGLMRLGERMLLATRADAGARTR